MYNKCVNRSTPRSVAAAAFSRTTGVNGRQSGTRLCGSRHSGTMVPSVPYGSRKRRPALLFENLFTLFRCSHHRKILCYVRMETARVPTRAVFTLHKMFAAETACQAHAVIYLPIPSAAPFYGIDAAKQQREERNRSSLCCLPHFFRSAFCSALRCFFAIRSAFFCSFAACHSFFC